MSSSACKGCPVLPSHGPCPNDGDILLSDEWAARLYTTARWTCRLSCRQAGGHSWPVVTECILGCRSLDAVCGRLTQAVHNLSQLSQLPKLANGTAAAEPAALQGEGKVAAQVAPDAADNNNGVSKGDGGLQTAAMGVFAGLRSVHIVLNTAQVRISCLLFIAVNPNRCHTTGLLCG